jgi:hypothetical protein
MEPALSLRHLSGIDPLAADRILYGDILEKQSHLSHQCVALNQPFRVDIFP